MTINIVQRRRIEVLVDRPLAPLLVDLAQQAGIASYSFLPVLGGAGQNGVWMDEEVSGAQAKMIFLTVASQDKTERLAELLAPLLDSHGLVLFISTVDVVRGARF
ncbi:hypothetical protein D5I55_00145 [Chakrabartia godavariana]|nr:hypothetical protein D5I55_00145 [Chakrabartia godavariana]